jgi:hypothetical protein
MTFENMDTGPEEAPADQAPPENGANNRSFMILAGILGAITLLALIFIAVYAAVLRPRQLSSRSTQEAKLFAQNTQVAQAITQTAAAANFTATPTQTRLPPTATATRTPTPVVAVPTNTRVVAQGDPRTATVAALLTQAAGIQRTPTARVTTTALPTTGFADQVGVPGMLALSILLIAVIFLARRLRMAG